MDYFDPNGECISVFDVCEAYQLLEAYYNVGGCLHERPSNRRRRESISCQLHRLRYSSGHRSVDLWLDGEELKEELAHGSDDENVRYVYFKKVLEWNLPIEDDDRRVIDRIFTIDAIEEWCPTYFRVPPWRPVLLDLDPGRDFLDPVTYVLQRPLEGARQTFRDVLGQQIEFNGYAEASRAARRLNKELQLDPSHEGS